MTPYEQGYLSALQKFGAWQSFEDPRTGLLVPVELPEDVQPANLRATPALGLLGTLGGGYLGSRMAGGGALSRIGGMLAGGAVGGMGGLLGGAALDDKLLSNNPDYQNYRSWEQQVRNQISQMPEDELAAISAGHSKLSALKRADIVVRDRKGNILKQQRSIELPDKGGWGLETVNDIEGIGVPESYAGDDYQLFPLRQDDVVREVLSVRPESARHLWEAPEDAAGLKGQLEYFMKNAPADTWRIWNAPYGETAAYRTS